MYRLLLLLFSVLLPLFLMGQHVDKTIDNIYIKGLLRHDTLCLSIATIVPNFQLSFLMQGMNINIKDSVLNTKISIQLPNAKDVKEKIHHHPNEVKAMHRHVGDEIRPDLLPLISALNDTCCRINSFDNQTITCSHAIVLNKENGEMIFNVYILPVGSIFPQDSVFVEILSSPMEMKSEFEGRRLSQENRMPTGGMGQPPKSDNDQNRIIRISKKMKIENCNE